MTQASRAAVLLSLLLAERVQAFVPSNMHGVNSVVVPSSDASSAIPKSTTQLFQMGRGNGYNNQRREEIVAFQVTTVFDQEELLARERDQPMFTPAVRRDIYRILRSPYNPSLGGDGPTGPNQMFGSVLLAKSSENNGPNAAWDTFAFASKGANPSGFVMLDDEQMLEAISSIGKITPVALAITQAFEAYLAQLVQLYWAEPEASQLSVEFLVAFGNELTQRLDVNARIRSTQLTPQEIEVLHQQPFANFVDNESLETFQGEVMRGMNMDAIRSAPPPEIIPLAGNYGHSDLGMNARANNGPAYNNNNNSNSYGRSTFGNNNDGNNNNNYSSGGSRSANNSPYSNDPYGRSQPPPRQNAPMPQQGYNGQNNNMDFNRHNDNNSYNPNGRSYAGGNTFSGNSNDSRNFGRNNNNNKGNGSYGGMPDQGRPLQGRTDGYNNNSGNNNNNSQYGGNNNDGIRSNSKMRGYDNASGGMNNSANNNGMNHPNGGHGNNNNSNSNYNGSYGYQNENNDNGQRPYGDNRGPPPQSSAPNNYGNNMNFNGGNNNDNRQRPYGDNRGPPPQSAQPNNFGNDMNFSRGNNNNNSNDNRQFRYDNRGPPPQQSGPPNNYGNNMNSNGGGICNNDNRQYDNNNRGPPQQSAPPNSFGNNNMNSNGGGNFNNNGGNNNNNNNNGGINSFGNGLYESVRRESKRDNALWDDNNRGGDGDKGWYENF